MTINTSKRDLLWSYISYGVNIGSNFILLPIMLKALSGSELGLWYSFLSVGGIIVLLDFGFAQTITRNVTYCYSGAKDLQKTDMAVLDEDCKPNYLLLSKLISTCKLLYLFISCIAAILLLIFGTLYVQYISKGIDNPKYILAWIIYSIGIIFNFYFGYYPCLLNGVGAIYQSSKATLISRMTQITISIIGLVMGYGLIALGAAYFINGLFIRLLSQRYFRKYKNNEKEISKYAIHSSIKEATHLLKILWYNAWRTGVSSMGSFLITQANTIICSLFLGLTVTGVYGLCIQLLTVIGALSQMLANTYLPALIESCIKEDVKRIKRILSVSVVSNMFIFWSGIILLCTIGMPLINILKPNTDIPLDILLFMSFAFFFERNQWVFSGYIVAKNLIPFMVPNIISGICIMICSYVFVVPLKMGIWGLALSNFLVMLGYNYWRWPVYVFKDLKITINEIFVIGISEFKSQLLQLKSRYYLSKK